jgi:hypothetical protein
MSGSRPRSNVPAVPAAKKSVAMNRVEVKQVAQLAAPAKRAQASAAPSTPRFEAKVDPSVCDNTTPECNSVINFCVDVVIPPGFSAVPDGQGHFLAYLAINDQGLKCNTIQCTQEIGITLDNPCVPGDTLQCTGTVKLNRVYVSGGVAAKVTLAIVPVPSGCGVAYEVVTFTIPVDDMLLCVSCADSPDPCPTPLICSCEITCVQRMTLAPVPPGCFPLATCDIPTTNHAFRVTGSIFLKQCSQPCPL